MEHVRNPPAKEELSYNVEEFRKGFIMITRNPGSSRLYRVITNSNQHMPEIHIQVDSMGNGSNVKVVAKPYVLVRASLLFFTLAVLAIMTIIIIGCIQNGRFEGIFLAPVVVYSFVYLYVKARVNRESKISMKCLAKILKVKLFYPVDIL